jgi:Zn-dependent protease with chaperone function
MFLGTVILSANSRNNEYQADEFAHQIGYGGDLIESLYLLQKMSLGEEMALVERMTASHPLLAKRIGRLEMLQEQESDESTDTE